uniref:Pentatricopeptide repeat-containing protein n=1 Tax=Ananas comosus var. bracteatus TaxID=296719 RepID=A0A6V7NKD2_ANACO|nr:unnamed protein product [Ananas comosus var. bracteatus]
MYAKCGSLDSARRVFDRMMPVRDTSAWTAMIAAHAHGEDAVHLFDEMVGREKLLPDSLTFTCALHACAHSGMAERGLKLFNEMQSSEATMLLEARSLPCFQVVFDVATFESSIGSVKLDLNYLKYFKYSRSSLTEPIDDSKVATSKTTWKHGRLRASIRITQNGLRATRGQHSVKESAKQQIFLLAVPVQDYAVPVQPARGMLAVPVQGYSVPVQATRTDSAALGLAPVPVQEPVYRYKGVLVESPVGDFVADVAPRAVRARLLPELCEEAGRGSVFNVLDVALRFDAVEVARSPRRNVGSRRGLVRWIRDFERNPRSPHLPDLVKLVHRTWRSPVDPAEVVLVRGFVRCLDLAFEVGYIGFTPNLIELDRDTLHTRLGSAHECHSGVRLVLSRWDGCIHSPGDGYAYSPDWIGSDLTFPTVEPPVSAAAPPADQGRGKGVAS